MRTRDWSATALVVAVVVAIVLAGCPLFPTGDEPDGEDTGPGDGTVTVALDGASAAPAGEMLVAYAYPEDESDLAAANVLATGNAVISGGSASVLLKEDDGDFGATGTDWTATGGSRYDIYIYTTDQASYDYGSNSRLAATWPEVVTVDGDQTVSVSYGDMVEAKTLTISVTGATDYEGATMFARVLPSGGDPGSDQPLAVAEAAVNAAGEAEALALSGGAAWTGTQGTSYDVYIAIDADGSGTTEPNAGDPVYNPDGGDLGPLSYTQTGNKRVDTDSGDYSLFATDGTVEVSLTGASVANGELLVAYAYDEGETALGDVAAVRGIAYAEIADGAASVVLEEVGAEGAPTGTEWTAAGGRSYDLYVYTTTDATDLDYTATTRIATAFPQVIEINGGYSADVAYGDMVARFLAVNIESADAHDGESFVAGVFPAGADPESTPDPMLGIARGVIASGGAYLMMQDVDGGVWEGTDGSAYDVYAFIDLNDNEWPDSGDWQYDGDGTSPDDPTDPYTYTQSGNEYVLTDYSAYVEVN